MRVKLEKRNYGYILYFLIGIVVLIPISCNYIMSGGIVTEWIARVTEIGNGLEQGHLYLFPQTETLVSAGIKVNGMNSNLWFFLPGILYWISGNVILVYRIYMLMVQAGTLLASLLLFRRIFPGEEGKMPATFGILLYMTCPYRIYVCYDLANLSQAVDWMLLPLYVWAVAGVMEGKERIQNLAFAALALAGMGYADTMFFVIAAGMTLFTSLILRKFSVLVSVAVGTVLFTPGLHRMVRYAFLGEFWELDMPLKSIMENGYRLGYYFNSYSFRDGHPGMGLGMMICLLAGLWLLFVENKRESRAGVKIFVWLAAFLAILSFYYFPWDFVQRLGLWALKLVSLIDNPSVFWGMACLCLCVPAASFVDRIRKCEEEWAVFAVPVIVILACIGVCVYQCNTLIYSRMPLDIL